jgi:glycosyltransferase involved in cell wall biosynthesis
MRRERRTAWRARTRRVGDGPLFAVTPQPTVPFSLHSRELNTFVHELTRYQLRPLLRSLNATEVDVIVGVPPAIALARRLPARAIIYDCLDYFSAFYQGRPARLMEMWEAELCESASDIVVSSTWMYERWRGRHSRVHRIPNGVELERFSPDQQTLVEPADLEAFPHPRLGYAGSVARWINFPLLTQVAQLCPAYSFVFIGPLLDGSKPADWPANVHWLGSRPYEQLPQYLGAMDVLLIPFKLMALTYAVNPVKLYEYAAMGKPIIATPIPDLAERSDICHLVCDTESFIAAVNDIMSESEASRYERTRALREFAQENRWEDRCGAFEAILRRS